MADEKRTKLEYAPKTTKPSIEEVCENLQDGLMSVAGHAEVTLHKLRNAVRGKKAAIAAELGADNAKALQAAYGHLKAFVECVKGITLDELPE